MRWQHSKLFMLIRSSDAFVIIPNEVMGKPVNQEKAGACHPLLSCLIIPKQKVQRVQKLSLETQRANEDKLVTIRD